MPPSDVTTKDDDYLMLHVPPNYLNGKDNADAGTTLPSSLPLQLCTLNSTADLDHVLSQFSDRLMMMQQWKMNLTTSGRTTKSVTPSSLPSLP